MIAFLFSPLGRYAAIALVVLGAFGFVYAKGYSNGSAHVQRNWDAAVAAAVERGTDARARAEAEIPAVADESAVTAGCELPVAAPTPNATPSVKGRNGPVAAPVMPRWLRDDKFRRDDR